MERASTNGLDLLRILHDDVLGALIVIRLGADHLLVDRATRRGLSALAGDRPVPFTWPDLSRSTPIDATIDHHGLRQGVPAHVQHALSDAAAEAIRNADRHACASRITVRGHRSHHSSVVITIDDDGTGFDAQKTRGFGVGESIVGRMHDAGGFATLTSAPGAGTKVTLRWSHHTGSAPRAHPVTSADADLVTELIAFLHSVLDGRSPVGTERTTAQAHRLITEVTSLLETRDVLDDSLRAGLRSARRRGAHITLRWNDPVADGPALRGALRTTLPRIADDHVTIRVAAGVAAVHTRQVTR